MSQIAYNKSRVTYSLLKPNKVLIDARWRPYRGRRYPIEFFMGLSPNSINISISLILRRRYYRWRVQMLISARHSWPLSSEGSVACRTVTWGITHTYCRAFSSGTVTTYFLIWSVVAGFENPTLRLQGERSNQRRDNKVYKKSNYKPFWWKIPCHTFVYIFRIGL